jgi:hypothetical protein
MIRAAIPMAFVVGLAFANASPGPRVAQEANTGGAPAGQTAPAPASDQTASVLWSGLRAVVLKTLDPVVRRSRRSCSALSQGRRGVAPRVVVRPARPGPRRTDRVARTGDVQRPFCGRVGASRNAGRASR